MNVSINIEDIANNLWDYIYQNTECVNGEPDYVSIAPDLPIITSAPLSTGEELLSSDNDETDLYFYLPA